MRGVTRQKRQMVSATSYLTENRNSRRLSSLLVILLLLCTTRAMAQAPIPPVAFPLPPEEQGVGGVSPNAGSTYDFNYLDSLSERMRTAQEHLESESHAYISREESLFIRQSVLKFANPRLKQRLANAQMGQELERLRKEHLEWRKQFLVKKKINNESRILLALEGTPQHPLDLRTGWALNHIFETIKTHRSSSPGIWEAMGNIPLNQNYIRFIRVAYGAGRSRCVAGIEGKPLEEYSMSPPEMLYGAKGLRELVQDLDKSRKSLESDIKRGSEVPDKTLDRIHDTLGLMSDVVAKWIKENPPERNLDRDYVLLCRWRAFIEQQYGFLTNLAAMGKSVPPKFEGKTLKDLADFMLLNGFEFAETPEGGENAYKAIFDGMKIAMQSGKGAIIQSDEFQKPGP